MPQVLVTNLLRYIYSELPQNKEPVMICRCVLKFCLCTWMHSVHKAYSSYFKTSPVHKYLRQNGLTKHSAELSLLQIIRVNAQTFLQPFLGTSFSLTCFCCRNQRLMIIKFHIIVRIFDFSLQLLTERKFMVIGNIKTLVLHIA